MKVEIEDKCLKPTKCFWYQKKDNECYASPYEGCVRNKAQKGEKAC